MCCLRVRNYFHLFRFVGFAMWVGNVDDDDDEDTLIVNVGCGSRYFETIIVYNGIEIMKNGSFLAPHVDKSEGKLWWRVIRISRCRYFGRINFDFIITIRKVGILKIICSLLPVYEQDEMVIG